MKKTILLILVSVLLMSGCGFKQLEDQTKFSINEINSSGDKRISYLLSNKMQSLIAQNKQKIINLYVDVKKDLSIKEKNIKNEITKYNITIIAKVKFNIVGANEEVKFTITNSGEYLTAKQYSTEKNNEKTIVKLLSHDLAKKIISRISTSLNDL